MAFAPLTRPSPLPHHLQCLHFTPNIILFWHTWQTCDSQDLTENLQGGHMKMLMWAGRPEPGREVFPHCPRETWRLGSIPEPPAPSPREGPHPERGHCSPRHSDVPATKSPLTKSQKSCGHWCQLPGRQSGNSHQNYKRAY